MWTGRTSTCCGGSCPTGPKIRARQVTGNNQQQQKEIARAIKNAREMALLPYNNRITTQRSASRMRDDSRFEGPVPQPSAPPPGMRPPGEMDLDDLEAAEVPVDGTPAEMPAEEAAAPVEADLVGGRAGGCQPG